MMTHRERVLKTFQFKKTDRVPYDLMEGSVWSELLTYFQNKHRLANTFEVQEFLDTDFRWIGMQYRGPNSDIEPVAPQTNGVTTHSNSIAQGPLAQARTIAEVESYSWPNPARWQPFGNFAQDRSRWPQHALVFSTGWWSLFWGACEAFGVEVALVNLITAPALFECAVSCIHERYMDMLTRGLEAAHGHCDICWLGDDFASQQSMFLSPEHWRRFIKPYLARQVELARSHDMYVIYHSCGAVRPVLADLIDIGINALLVFQTTARGMDAESIARDFGGRMVFYGGIDVQQLLSFGTTEDVAAEVRANIRAFSRCGGYVVANSHHGVATISGRNTEAMCEEARK